MGGSEAYQWLCHASGVRGVRNQRHRLPGGYLDNGCSSRWIRLYDRQAGFLVSYDDYPRADALVSVHLLIPCIFNSVHNFVRIKLVAGRSLFTTRHMHTNRAA